MLAPLIPLNPKPFCLERDWDDKTRMRMLARFPHLRKDILARFRLRFNNIFYELFIRIWERMEIHKGLKYDLFRRVLCGYRPEDSPEACEMLTHLLHVLPEFNVTLEELDNLGQYHYDGNFFEPWVYENFALDNILILEKEKYIPEEYKDVYDIYLTKIKPVMLKLSMRNE